ncbi:hypothetical protein ACFLXE_07165 [Chloroflexota bacterium]
MKITLDYNCLVSLKEKDGEHAEIKSLVELHPYHIVVFIPAIAASENQQGGRLHTNFDQFEQFLREIKCERCELLNPMWYWDVSYLDHMVVSDEQMVSFEREIHDILFPNIPFEYPEYCRRFGLNVDDGTIKRKWRNAKCDVQAMWCHIQYGNDIFVTQDGNFLKATKKRKLVVLGAQKILRPKQCLSQLKA